MGRCVLFVRWGSSRQTRSKMSCCETLVGHPCHRAYRQFDFALVQHENSYTVPLAIRVPQIAKYCVKVRYHNSADLLFIIRWCNRCKCKTPFKSTFVANQCKRLTVGAGSRIPLAMLCMTSLLVKFQYGFSPYDIISHIRIPKLHTSLAEVYSRNRIHSGAVHRSAIFPPCVV